MTAHVTLKLPLQRYLHSSILSISEMISLREFLGQPYCEEVAIQLLHDKGFQRAVEN